MGGPPRLPIPAGKEGCLTKAFILAPSGSSWAGACLTAGLGTSRKASYMGSVGSVGPQETPALLPGTVSFLLIK